MGGLDLELEGLAENIGTLRAEGGQLVEESLFALGKGTKFAKSKGMVVSEAMWIADEVSNALLEWKNILDNLAAFLETAADTIVAADETGA